MLPHVWVSILAVFAFIFLAAVGGLAASGQLAAMFAAHALAVATMAALALGVLFLAGVLVHQVSALFVIIKCTLWSRELSADHADQVYLFFTGRWCLSLDAYAVCCRVLLKYVVVQCLVMFVGVIGVFLVDGLAADPELVPPIVALSVLCVCLKIHDEEGHVDSHSKCHRFVDQYFLESNVVHHLFVEVELHGDRAQDLFKDVRGFQAVDTRNARCCQFIESVVVDALVLPLGLLEDRGQGIDAARLTKFLFETFFDAQDGLVYLV